MPFIVPDNEFPYLAGALIPAGALVVIATTNRVVMNPVSQTAAALAASLGVGPTQLNSCNEAARYYFRTSP
jgi:hypothetical protein